MTTMATARDVFKNAIALIDEISPEAGGVDQDTTSAYEARAPFLIDLLQTEVAMVGNYRKTVDIKMEANSAESVGGYVPVSLPGDVEAVDIVLVVEPPGYPRKVTMIETNAVYVDSDFSGTLRITYVPIVTPIKSLEDKITVNALCQTAMAWGLARTLVAPERDKYLTAFFDNEFEKQKTLISRKKPSGVAPIADVYGF